MDVTFLVGPVIIPAIISATVVWIIASRRLKVDRELAERKISADIDLAERKFDFDKRLAENKMELDIEIAERKAQLDVRIADRKKRQELAEEVLSGFYQASEIVRAIRSPLGYEDEAKDRPKSIGETDDVARQRDTYYAIIVRFDARRQDLANLVARRYRMIAWFGTPAEQPFQQLQEALNAIVVAAQLLIKWSGGQTSAANSNSDLLHKLERDIWWSGDETDPITSKIEAATREMESICRPILESDAG